MTPFALIFIVVLILIGMFYLLARSGQKEANVIGQKATELLTELDNQYEAFIDHKLILAEKEQVLDLSIENLTEEAMIILKPNIDGLMSHINANKNYNNIKVDYYSRYFKSAVPTVDAYFLKSYQTKGMMLPDSDEEKFSLSFENAIRSDLKRRFLELKSGS